jgi:hypothetical protein
MSTLVAELEIGTLFGRAQDPVSTFVSNKMASFAMMAVHVNLRTIVDLTDPITTESLLATTGQELTGDWHSYNQRLTTPHLAIANPRGLAPTQELGQALQQTGIEGFLTPSAKMASVPNLVVFPGNLQAGSWVRVYDPFGRAIHSVP